MELWALAPIIVVLCLGAMSPGPSLAVLIRNTIEGGRGRGVMCGIGHGIGFGIYALFAISGIAELKSAGGGKVAMLLELIGALFLIYLAGAMLKKSDDLVIEHSESDYNGFSEGFMIAFLNPKILAFLIAIFSQFIEPEFTWFERILIASIAMIIDGGWYVLVAMAITGTSLLEKIQAKRRQADIAMGIVLASFAIWIVYHATI